MISDVTKAYIAGIIDGEGSISFEIHHSPATTVNPRITVTNTCYELLYFVGEAFNNGHIYNRPLSALGKKPLWELRFYKRETLKEILSLVLPFLIVKQKQAKLMLEYLQRDNHRKGYSKREIELFKEVRRLNGRKELNWEEVVER